MYMLYYIQAENQEGKASLEIITTKMSEAEKIKLKLEIIQFILDCNDEAILARMEKILREG